MVSARVFRLPAALTAIAVIGAIAGCASAPSGGAPRRATGSGSQVQSYVQPLPPPPPTKSWTAADVVLGFVHASASYAFDPAAAEQYLAPQLRKSWHRRTRGPVAVVGAPTPAREPYNKPQSPAGAPVEIVKLTGQLLATLSQTGQYRYTPGQTVEYQFILAKTAGVWLIDALPQTQQGLLLTQSDFERVYQARNLFFPAPAQWQDSGYVLVPDPVYAPLESSDSALNTSLATRLINGLIKGPGDWLSGATSSAFPSGTKLKQVTIAGRVAQVNLGGAAAHASPVQIQIMEAQLRATLEDRSYSVPLASDVQLYINNRPQAEWPLYSGLTAAPVNQGPPLVVTGLGGVGQLSDDPRKGERPAARVAAAQIARSTISAVAAEPGHGRTPEIAVAVQNGTGCTVFLPTGNPVSYRPYGLSTSGGACTSLSWDNSGNIWAAAGGRAWVLRSQNRQPIAVDVGSLTSIGLGGSHIQALRMAPDSVRAALLVQTKSGKNKLLLAAARFGNGTVGFRQFVTIGALPGIGTQPSPNPLAMSWWDAYHLVVLADNGFIYTMPLTGGAGIQPSGSPQQLLAPDGAETLTTDGSELVVGAIESGVNRIFASSPASPWTPVTSATDPAEDPVYPG